MDVMTFPVNLETTSDLSILLHGVISLPDATSYDKFLYRIYLFILLSQSVIYWVQAFDYAASIWDFFGKIDFLISVTSVEAKCHIN